MDKNSVKNQEIKRVFVAREVGECVSALVYELAQKAECFKDYYDDLLDAFRGVPDYEEAAEGEGWKRSANEIFFKADENQYYLSVNLNERGEIYVSIHHMTEPGQGSNGKEIWSFSGPADEGANLDGSESLDLTDADEVLEYLQSIAILPDTAKLSDDEQGDFETSDADSWQDLCEDENIDTADYESEIYEHWIVSDWLASKLEDHGHRILRDFFGLTVWGRSASGQAILLDGVISDICEGMEILEGQAHEWKV